MKVPINALNAILKNFIKIFNRKPSDNEVVILNKVFNRKGEKGVIKAINIMYTKYKNEYKTSENKKINVNYEKEFEKYLILLKKYNDLQDEYNNLKN